MKVWWWLSFSLDAGWGGGTLVEAESFAEAIEQSWKHQCNPGGEVKGIELGPGSEETLLPMKPRLLYSKDQLAEVGINVERI